MEMFDCVARNTATHHQQYPSVSRADDVDGTSMDVIMDTTAVGALDSSQPGPFDLFKGGEYCVSVCQLTIAAFDNVYTLSD